MLPTLKEQLQRDAESGAAWFNEGEFADWHEINGKKILSVLCSDERMMPVAGTSRKDERPEGVMLHRGVLFLRAADVVGLPKRGQTLNIDGKVYAVELVQPIGGAMVKIRIEANDI